MGRRKGAALTREAVVAEAVRCVEELGIEGLSMNALAQRLGIRTPSLYNHVAGVEDLRTAVADVALGRMVAELDAAYEKLDDLSERITAGCWIVLEFARKNPGLYRNFILSTRSRDEVELLPGSRMDSNPVERWLRARGIPEEQMLHGSRALRAALHGFVLMDLSGSFTLGSVEESFAWLLATLTDAITTVPKD